jgi:nicotinate phosphoribosyltransferase
VELFASEEEAFEAVASAYNRYTLLLDTYDPRQAIHTAIAVARRAQDRWEHTLAAVRLDSGDLLGDSLYVREQLDAAGLTAVRIVASGDLDEWKILALVQTGAALDAFGVGTALGAGAGSVEYGVPERTTIVSPGA